MSFHYLSNTPLKEALEEYINILTDNGLNHKTETIPVIKSSGRITAQAVYATFCSPHYNASAMDGIAVIASDTYGASETTPAILTKEKYKYVDTGDPLPDNYDAVVMIEDVINIDTEQNGSIKLYEAVSPWSHIRQIGEDICAGEMILTSYTKISPSAVGALIAGGINEIVVIKKPIVGFIPTGDEIVSTNNAPKTGEIPEFNSAIFSAMLSDYGAEPKVYDIVPDDKAKIKSALKTAIKECDIVLLGAGSSAGREDYSALVISEVGEVVCHGIAIKPGKPTILGFCKNKPIIGLPGYPVSGIIVLDQILRPIIDLINKTGTRHKKIVKAKLTKTIVSSLKYKEFVRVRMGYVQDNLIATPLAGGSGIVTSFMRADGIVEVPQGVEGYVSGETVDVRLLRPIEELQQSLVVIGSHDPLLDELADILQMQHRDILMRSAHVGSMGGLLAIRNGQAHVAGIHLLDEKTGLYNESFVKKMLPENTAHIIKCVKRQQGLIVKKGNPKNITGISDLIKNKVRFVNRQKGSGTRILMDYLCKKENIDTTKIYGYDREEFTHTSVAALIASDSSDVGLGIYSAAKLYDLDFLHICDEEYDLLIANHAQELPMVQKLLEAIQSEEFENRLKKLGGYNRA
ncbi:MAG: molybdopterin biosynthesis protein [Oscillospiraceae bacterium]|jgi:putative molybdopterin biosynthesis protein|nr:molybdopterin biosynthesis protein [Oscillospiraceae bacterium]